MSATYPTYILQPFAISGSKNTIPNLSSPTPGLASFQTGFPPLTMTPIQSGGVPPSGLDFNGVFNAITQHSVWVNSGGLYKFDSSLSAFLGGYTKGMVLQDNAGVNSYISLVNNNTTDFNSTPSSIGTLWGLYAGGSAGVTQTTITTTGGTVTLTTNQAAADVILVNGTLASASTIVFPAIANKIWKLINATTGAFSMVARGPAGQTLTMTQGFTNTVMYDGATSQLIFPLHDSGLDSPAFRGIPTAPTAAPLTNNTQLATTAYANAADQALLINTPLTGVPTAPTAAPSTNTTQVANCAFVQQEITSAVTNVTAQYVNGNFTAGGIGDLWTDTSSAGFTITLPDPPIGKNLLTFRDIFGTWVTKPLTINPGTKTILGVSGTLIANVSGRTFGMWYDTANTTWKLI